MARLPRRYAEVQNLSIPYPFNLQYPAGQLDKMKADSLLYIHNLKSSEATI